MAHVGALIDEDTLPGPAFFAASRVTGRSSVSALLPGEHQQVAKYAAGASGACLIPLQQLPTNQGTGKLAGTAAVCDCPAINAQRRLELQAPHSRPSLI